MKYLIIKCEELMDTYECDANRIPVCITEKEEIVKMKEFKKFVNKYLHREYKFAKHDFLHNGCCESIDHTNLNNCIVISTKQGKYIDRGY